MDEKIIRKEVLVPATRQELWDSWTTTEGVMSFLAPQAKIELAVGGSYECYFRLDQPPGLQGSEECKVLAFWPMDYISFSWNTPPEFPAERSKHTKVVVEIDRADEKDYRVILTHMDFGEGGQWEEVYQFFDKAWDFALESLREKFETKE